MVLRVSRTLVFVLATAFTNSLVRVAMPLMRCIRLRMTRSQERMAAALWRMTARGWAFFTFTPSKISGGLTTSKRPTGGGDILAKMARNTGIQPRPETTQACLAVGGPEGRGVGGVG